MTRVAGRSVVTRLSLALVSPVSFSEKYRAAAICDLLLAFMLMIERLPTSQRTSYQCRKGSRPA